MMFNVLSRSFNSWLGKSTRAANPLATAIRPALESLERRVLFAGTPYLGTPVSLPGTIMLDNFDNGGEAVAYHDTTAANLGGSYRTTDGVDIETTSDVTPPGLTAANAGVGFNIGHISAGEWMNYTVNVATTATYSIDARVASAVSGGKFHVEFDGTNVTGTMSLANTGGWQTWATVTVNNISLMAGQHVMKLMIDSTTSNETGNMYFLQLRQATVTPPTETPFLGTAVALPGTVVADNFDNGGEGLAYHDTTITNQGGSYRTTEGVDIEPITDSTPPGLASNSPGVGFDIGYTTAGEWMNYMVNVTTAGTYSIDVRAASGGSGGTFHVEIDNVNVTGVMTLTNTGGWQTYKTITVNNVSLTAGAHIMKLMVDTVGSGGFGNFNYVRVYTPVVTPPTESPFLGSPFAVPGTIMLDNFDTGGEGVAYHDTGSTNQGGAYRTSDGVDIEASTDSTPPGLTSSSPGVGFNIGHIVAGEWMKYTVNVTAAGTYALDARIASAAGGLFHVEIDGSNVTGQMTLSNTGGWGTWATVTSQNFTLAAGQHILRLAFDGTTSAEMGNMEWLQLRQTTVVTNGAVNWVTVASSPIARDEGQAITINNNLYAFGGFYDVPFDPSNRCDVYNIGTNKWTQLANMPETTNHAGLIYDSSTNRIWMVGGFTNMENGPASAHVWEYSIANNTWTAGPSLPSGVGAEAVVLVGRNIHVISGLNFTQNNNTSGYNTTEHWVMNLDNQAAGWTNAAAAPTSRNHAGFVTANGLIYLIGGQNIINETAGNSAAVEIYDPSNNLWTTGASLPQARGHISTSTLVDSSGHILVIGGETNGATTRDDILSYDPIANTWTALTNANFPSVRKSPIAGLFGDLLVVTGGQTSVPQANSWEATLTPAWKMGAVMPVSLGEVASGIIGTKMYVVGQESATTYVYDLVAGTWSTAAARPHVGDHHAAEVFNGKLYLIGGLDNGSPGSVQIYNPATNSWSAGANMPFAAGSVSTALINGKIYAAGGIVGSSTTNLAAVYDPVANTWTSIASMPMGVNHAASATDGSKLYVFGGRTGGNTISTGFNEVEIYNPVSNTWVSSTQAGSTLAPLPQARGGMGKAVYYNGEFYIMGGETVLGTSGATVNGVYNRVDIYNPITNTWRLGTPMPTARHGIFPLLYNNSIYVAGGGVHEEDSNSVLLEIYNLGL